MPRSQTVSINRLPDPRTSSPVSLEEAMLLRSSIRAFSGQPLTAEQISQILWAGNGMSFRERDNRNAPSAGALYPIAVYALTSDGLSRYLPREHALEPLLTGDFRAALASAAFSQDFIVDAGMTVILSADYSAIRQHYGDRGTRYADMEAGHIAQNIMLEAASLYLGSVPVGAFDTSAVASLLHLPPLEEPIYLIPTGYPR